MINVFPAEKHTERFDLVFAHVHALHGCDNDPYRGYCHRDVLRGGENERGYRMHPRREIISLFSPCAKSVCASG
jgi:hypothetical protein